MMIEVASMGLFDRLKSIVLGKKEVSETELRAQQHYKEGMKKTRGNLLKQLQSVFSSYTDVNEELFEELEDIFIMADIGVSTVVEFIDQLKESFLVDLSCPNGSFSPAATLLLDEPICGSLVTIKLN